MAEQISAQGTGAEQDDVELGALETVMLRNDFYRENYRRLTMTCLILVGILGFSLSLTYYVYATRPAPQYFATTADGALIKLYPLSQPNMSDAALLTWATEAITSAYSFNFVNYREILNNNRTNFTKRGYQLYIKAINASNNLQAVINKKLVVRAVPTAAPMITAKGLSGEIYAWRVEMPLLISYESASDNIRQSIVVKLLIKRVDTLENTKGIGIEQFLVFDAR